jgi:hypothetical protein
MDGRGVLTVYLSNISMQCFLSLLNQEHPLFHLKKTLYSFLWHIQIAQITPVVWGHHY